MENEDLKKETREILDGIIHGVAEPENNPALIMELMMNMIDRATIAERVRCEKIVHKTFVSGEPGLYCLNKEAHNGFVVVWQTKDLMFLSRCPECKRVCFTKEQKLKIDIAIAIVKGEKP